jgi:hypothetical protein
MEELNFDIMLEKIRNNEPFSYARYGDGEWNAILQKKPGGRNCDGHEYFPDLGQRLKEILESQPQYYLGLQNLSKEQNEGTPEFDRLVALNNWTDNEIMHRASIKGRMNEFFDALKGAHVIIVGNNSLKNLPIEHSAFLGLPDKDCWLVYKKLKPALLQLAQFNSVILYCASMMSEVLIDDMWGGPYIQIDCGSVFDPYVGKQTRSYHKDLKLG